MFRGKQEGGAEKASREGDEAQCKGEDNIGTT